MEEKVAPQKKSYRSRKPTSQINKRVGKTKNVASLEPTIDELVYFKKLKEQGDENATLIWNDFNLDHDSVKFHRSILELLHSEDKIDKLQIVESRAVDQRTEAKNKSSSPKNSNKFAEVKPPAQINLVDPVETPLETVSRDTINLSAAAENIPPDSEDIAGILSSLQTAEVVIQVVEAQPTTDHTISALNLADGSDLFSNFNAVAYQDNSDNSSGVGILNSLSSTILSTTAAPKSGEFGVFDGLSYPDISLNDLVEIPPVIQQNEMYLPNPNPIFNDNSKISNTIHHVDHRNPNVPPTMSSDFHHQSQYFGAPVFHSHPMHFSPYHPHPNMMYSPYYEIPPNFNIQTQQTPQFAYLGPPSGNMSSNLGGIDSNPELIPQNILPNPNNFLPDFSPNYNYNVGNMGLFPGMQGMPLPMYGIVPMHYRPTGVFPSPPISSHSTGSTFNPSVHNPNNHSGVDNSIKVVELAEDETVHPLKKFEKLILDPLESLVEDEVKIQQNTELEISKSDNTNLVASTPADEPQLNLVDLRISEIKHEDEEVQLPKIREESKIEILQQPAVIEIQPTVVEPQALQKLSGGKEKSKALLSFLKSKPGAAVVNPFTKAPVPVFAESNVQQSETATIVEKSAVAPVAHSEPIVETRESLSLSSSQEISGQLRDANAQDSAAADGATDNAKEDAKPATRAYRTTRNQRGKLSVSLLNQKKQDFFPKTQIILRPSSNFNVHWSIPESEVDATLTPSPDLSIALTRYGSLVNLPCIIAKSVGKNFKKSLNEEGIPVLQGKVPFRTPKSGGKFVLRLIDQTKERSHVTLGTSSPLFVELDDPDIVSSLKFILDLFPDKANTHKAIMQFTTAIEFMKPSGRPSAITTNLISLLCKCIDKIISGIAEYGELIDEYNKDREKLEKTEIEATCGDGDEGATSFDKDRYKSVVTGFKIHAEAHEAFVTLESNRGLLNILDAAILTKINNIEAAYCPILQRYFESAKDLLAGRKSELGFLPVSPRGLVFGRHEVEAIDRTIVSILPQLFPKSDFEGNRENFRHRVEEILLGRGVIMPGSSVALYGSSKSNFGSDGADVDMCMIFPEGLPALQIEDKRLTICAVGKALEESGMINVEVISTARIPIASFQDPISGLEGDITFHNPLALSNTRLMRAYSEIDPRTRAVAYLIKRWAQNRFINAPGEGTLSSYGYIICLIHFLQKRPEPVLPHLQMIPPSWSGENISDSHHVLPQEIQLNPADGSESNTYFFQGDTHTKGILKAIAARNRESPVILLFEFFSYFAWHFDYKKDVVSIRQPVAVSKLAKAESNSWNLNDRLSVEDPFEIGYDVAHVIKPVQMKYIRKEFLRGFTLMAEAMSPPVFGQEAGSRVRPEKLLETLFEKPEPPKFSLPHKG